MLMRKGALPRVLARLEHAWIVSGHHELFVMPIHISISRHGTAFLADTSYHSQHALLSASLLYTNKFLRIIALELCHTSDGGCNKSMQLLSACGMGSG